MTNSASPGAAAQILDGRFAASGSPRLLVSVRSAAEARAAVQGGADIIDVKEPRRGSLGMADAETIAAVVELVRKTSPDLTVSAAMGELWDYDLQIPRLASGLRFVKLGLAGMGESADWPDRWRTVRLTIEQQYEFPINWVGVAYADAHSAGAPPVEAVITEAAAAGCAGVLIDTFGKSDGRLIDQVGSDRLHEWANRAHQMDMFFALAGRIEARDLPMLESISADVIAVRSAVCPAQRRDAELSSDLVTSFRQQLHQIHRPAVT